MLSRNVLCYGSEERLPDSIALRAGPLSLTFENGEIRRIKLGNLEILRRIYVALRLKYWITVPPRLSSVRVEITDDTFRIAFDAVHKQGEAHFRWKGTITGDERGTITFKMDGEVRSTFQRSRIGICALHPIEGYSGQPCTVEKSDGTKEEASLPILIAPHQLSLDVRAFSREILPGVRAEVRYSGDTFEMEDQRNWSDASFKTYSTTLALPVPVEVKSGMRISQSVTLSISGKMPPPSPSTVEQPGVALSISSVPVGPLPGVGLGQASHGLPLTSHEILRLELLRLSHMRVDMKLFQPDCEPKLILATSDSKSLKVPLELAIFHSDKLEEELKLLADLLKECRPAVRLCHVFNMGGSTTTAEHLKLFRKVISDFDGNISVGSGTNNYFVELNRNRPGALPADSLCYSMNPQVHTFDNDAIVYNIGGQEWTVRTAKEFAAGRSISVTPVTLQPRFVRGAPDDVQIGPNGLPRCVDPRQMSLLGAAWTVGSIRHLSEAGANSLTYYETTGWCGVMETETGSSAPYKFHSIAGAVYPIYHVLADIGEFAGGEILPVISSDRLRIEGLALRAGSRTRILVANMSRDSQRVTVDKLPTQTSVRHLDETNAEEAMRHPEKWRKQEGLLMQPVNGRLAIEILPFSVATLDCG
jgi:hypothetical protein